MLADSELSELLISLGAPPLLWLPVLSATLSLLSGCPHVQAWVSVRSSGAG